MRFPRLTAAGWRPSFRRLRWRLTVSYTLFTVAAILLLEALSLLVLHTFLPHAAGGATKGLILEMRRAAAEIAPLLQRDPPDQSSLLARLGERRRQKRMSFSNPTRGPGKKPSDEVRPIWAVFDAKGRLVALEPLSLSAGNGAVSIEEAVAAALGRRAVSSPRTGRTRDGRFVVAVPVLGAEEEPLGALVALFPRPRGPGSFLLPLLHPRNTVLILFVAGLVGAAFGFFTGGWLTRRLSTIAAATEAWGRGDFSVVARDEAEDEIGALARRLNKMAGKIQELLQDRARLAVMEERNRLARDLHDSLTQAIYSLNLYGEAAGRLLAAGEVQTAAAHLAEIRAAARQALREMRLLVFALRPPALEQEGLVVALGARLEAVEARAGIRAELKAEGIDRLAPAVEEGLYRIAQEALNNILKHAQATQVTVRLVRQGGAVIMEIADDGVGFDPLKGEGQGGLGLSGMAERAAALGGRLSIESAPGGGTVVRVEVKDG
ncbi:MAG: sensor histidine kinase [Firmicutes bacterium]|nr:sensor histidine kinase [Bacillota bacterium]